jgi:hypothetical protein
MSARAETLKIYFKNIQHEKKNKLWLYCIQVLYRHVVPCFHTLHPISTERDEGTGHELLQCIPDHPVYRSIVDQETEFVAIPVYCLPS